MQNDIRSALSKPHSPYFVFPLLFLIFLIHKSSYLREIKHYYYYTYPSSPYFLNSATWLIIPLPPGSILSPPLTKKWNFICCILQLKYSSSIHVTQHIWKLAVKFQFDTRKAFIRLVFKWYKKIGAIWILEAKKFGFQMNHEYGCLFLNGYSNCTAL